MKACQNCQKLFTYREIHNLDVTIDRGAYSKSIELCIKCLGNFCDLLKIEERPWEEREKRIKELWPETIAKKLDDLRIMVNESHKRRKFYDFLFSSGYLVDRNSKGPSTKAIEESFASLFREFENVVFDLNPMLKDFQDNPFGVARSELWDSWGSFSWFRNISPDEKSRKRIFSWLARNNWVDGRWTVTDYALENGYAKKEKRKLYAWSNDGLSSLYNTYLDTVELK